jgi:maltose/moltooligosaccharide transporter
MFHIPFPLVLLTTGNLQRVLPSFSLQFVPSDLWSSYTTKEPTEEEKKIKSHYFLHHLLIYFRIKPKVMWQLALVYLFQWYALFCYWQNSSKVLLSVWNTTQKEIIRRGRKLDRFSKRMVQYSNFLMCFDWFILLEIRRRWFISLVYC